MTVSIARLTAKAGVRYLLNTTMQDDVQVRPQDRTDYYIKSGTPSGRWIGSGLAGIDKQPLDLVTAADAKSVFTLAEHPVTHRHLGRGHGETTMAHRNGEETQRHAVAGFDLTFSVPKSISVLWALAPREIQRQILQAHHDAVNAAIAWLEDSAIHTRAGRGGIAHVGTRGIIAAAFDHWESRARDPQLHTHVVIANRVQRITDGAWVTLDSRSLHKAVVAASEHYNGLLLDRLQASLGTVAGYRPPSAHGRNPSHELVGLDDVLLREFSNRSRLIDAEAQSLIRSWTREHGRRPSATVVVKLRQQATLSTRRAKDTSAIPLDQLAAGWRKRASALGFEPADVVGHVVRRSHDRPITAGDLSPAWIDSAATLARQVVAQRRATWNRWNLLAEAERICADVRCSSPTDRRRMIEAVASAAQSQSVRLNHYRYTLPADARPDLAFASQSVFDFHGARLYTDAGILANEQLIMEARNDDGGPAVGVDVTIASFPSLEDDVAPLLAPDQRAAALQILGSGSRLDAVVGPAGSGKTTTMAAIKAAWEQAYGTGSVVGLAPAAASADVLGRELGLKAENIAKWLYESVGQGAAHRAEQFHDLEGAKTRSRQARLRALQRMTELALRHEQWQLKAHQLVIIDEASMVSTAHLAALVHQARDAGAKILLVGDPAQLDAIDAGGMLGWLDRSGKTIRLTSIHRFHEAWEGPASSQLRSGDFDAIKTYTTQGRIRHGDYAAMIDDAYRAWAADTEAGMKAILIAPDNDAVTALNERAHAELVDKNVVDSRHVLPLSDGLRAGRGDTIIARKNNRRMTDTAGDFIRNGTLVRITSKPDRHGTVTGTRLDTGNTIRLSGTYLAESAELGYATTAHRSQGITVDSSHIVLTQGCLTRELFYVGMTRGRKNNTAYVCETLPDPLAPDHAPERTSWLQIMGEVLAAEGAEHTAHEVRDELARSSDSLHTLATEYDYLAQLAGADDLRAAISAIQPDAIPVLDQSPSWGASVAVWRRATTINARATDLVLSQAVLNPGDAKDRVAVIHARLRALVGSHPADADAWLHEDLRTSRPDLADMVSQVRGRAAKRISTLTEDAILGDEIWTRRLRASVSPAVAPAEVNNLIAHVAAYRDRWRIGADVDTLGPPPADYEWEQRQDRLGLEAELERLQRVAEASPVQVSGMPLAPSLTAVGREL